MPGPLRPAPVLLAAPTPLTLPVARPAPESQPELWLYLRGLGARRELVCKVFDSSHRWQYADLVEAAEQTVRHFEELDLERDLARA